MQITQLVSRFWGPLKEATRDEVLRDLPEELAPFSRMGRAQTMFLYHICQMAKPAEVDPIGNVSLAEGKDPNGHSQRYNLGWLEILAQKKVCFCFHVC